MKEKMRDEEKDFEGVNFDKYSSKEDLLHVIKEYESISELEYAKEEWLNDSGFMKKVIDEYPEAVDYIGEELLNNAEFMKFAISSCEEKAENVRIGEKLKEDENFQFWLATIKLYEDSMIEEKFWNNPKFMEYVINNEELLIDDDFMKHVGEEIRNNKEFMFEMNNRCPDWTLDYIGSELRKDKEVIKKIKEELGSGYAISLMDKELEQDKEFILQILENDLEGLEEITDELISDKEFILKLVEQDNSGEILSYLDSDMIHDKDIIKTVLIKGIKEKGKYLEKLAKTTKGDKEFSKVAKQCLEELKKEEKIVQQEKTQEDD